MRIRTQFLITMLLFCLILVVIAASAIIIDQQMEETSGQETLAANIAQGASELSYLAQDFLIYRESQQLTRWRTRADSFSAQVDSLRATRPEDQALISNIQANRKRLREVFDSVASAPRGPGQDQDAILDVAAFKVSWSRMAVQSQALMSDASRLSQLLHQKMDHLTTTRTRLIYVMVALFGGFILASYLLTYRRILKSLAALQAGTKIIGAGNLEFKIEEKKDDEIGDLSRAFNRMAADLKRVTASKSDLEREMGERRQAEEALRESEQRWAVTLASIGDAVIATDLDGRVTFLNRVAQELTGWGLPEAVGKPLAHVFRIINELTRESVEDPVVKVLRSGAIVGLANHTVLLRRGGGEVPIDDSGAPIRDEEGSILGVVLIFRDITERKWAEEVLRTSEQRYRRLVETASEGIWQINTELRTVDINQRMAQMLGRPKEEIIGRHIREFMAPDEMADVEQRIEHRKRGMSEAYERRLLRKDGTTLATLVSVTPLRDNQGEVIGSFGMFTDISKHKKAEEDLRRLNETLEQRVAERTELAEFRARQLQALAVELIEAEERERRRVAELLHDDLQQVLAAARMQLETACMRMPSESSLVDVNRMLEESLKKARRLSHELSPAVLHHSGLVPTLKWLAGQMKDQFGLDVQMESDSAPQFESLPLKVFLFRAVQELLFNVVKHSGATSAHVVITALDSCLSISVSDHGRGFDPRILDSATAPAGLGLLSLRERARYIGGGLTIDSDPRQGSRFTLTVPISLYTAHEIEGATAGQRSRTGNEASGLPGADGIRVLFVDDHHVMRQGLIRLMTGQPDIHVVGEAANGREAIEQARQLKPHVIVMDVSMPEMDGIEATRRIKADLPEVHVIGLSMYEEEHLARSMRAAGAEAFVSKTASPAELLKVIYEAGRRQYCHLERLQEGGNI